MRALTNLVYSKLHPRAHLGEALRQQLRAGGGDAAQCAECVAEVGVILIHRREKSDRHIAVVYLQPLYCTKIGRVCTISQITRTSIGENELDSRTQYVFPRSIASILR